MVARALLALALAACAAPSAGPAVDEPEYASNARTIPPYGTNYVAGVCADEGSIVLSAACVTSAASVSVLLDRGDDPQVWRCTARSTSPDVETVRVYVLCGVPPAALDYAATK